MEEMGVKEDFLNMSETTQKPGGRMLGQYQTLRNSKSVSLSTDLWQCRSFPLRCRQALLHTEEAEGGAWRLYKLYVSFRLFQHNKLPACLSADRSVNQIGVSVAAAIFRTMGSPPAKVREWQPCAPLWHFMSTLLLGLSAPALIRKLPPLCLCWDAEAAVVRQGHPELCRLTTLLFYLAVTNV